MSVMDTLLGLFLGNERTQEQLQDLGNELQNYATLQRDFLRLYMVEKLTRLFSFMFFLLLMVVLGMMALFYAASALAHYLAPLVGGLVVGYGLISVGILLLTFLAMAFRKRLIVRPLAGFLAGLFLND